MLQLVKSLSSSGMDAREAERRRYVREWATYSFLQAGAKGNDMSWHIRQAEKMWKMLQKEGY